MSEVRYRREIVEFIIGAPDTPDGSWQCGCRAIASTETEIVIDPCDEHRTEFEEKS